MSGKTAAIIGSTGLTGSYLLELLLKDETFSTISVIVRRPVPKTDPKMEVKLVDFNDAESFKLALEGTHTILCCIGTTTKKVKGNKENYRRVDFDIPVNAARFGKEAGCETFIVVSSVGANSSSRTFYLKLKGEMEEALKKVAIRSLYILRPGMLLGARKEFRLGEKIGAAIMKPLSFLFPANYKPIHARKVARAMLIISKQPQAGTFTYGNKEIEK